VHRSQSKPRLADPQVVEWAEQAFAALRDMLGADQVAAAFQAVRAGTTKRRRERRKHEVLEAAIDPAASARRKTRRNERRVADKKRKAQDAKVLREAGVSRGVKRVKGAQQAQE
jgi:hypothetical protein